MYICTTNSVKMWSKAELRRSMLLEKAFLSNIHQSSALTISNTLAAATNFQLNVLIKVLHFVASGQIPVCSNLIENLSLSRKTGYLHKNFRSRAIVRTLLSGNRQTKLVILSKINRYIPKLLERLVWKS